MLKLAADENFNNDVVRGLLRRRPDLDIVCIHDTEITGSDDASVLEWTAQNHRILLTHDVSTMTAHAYQRARDGKSMPGVFEVGRNVPTGVLSKISCCWLNAAMQVNGKDRCAICPCVE